MAKSGPKDDAARLRALIEADPMGAAKLFQQLNAKVIHPHEGQQLVLDSDARFKVMNCGRRWGKTVLAAKIITQKARRDKKMLWWIAPTYRVTKRGYDEVLRQLPEGMLAKPAPPASNFDSGRPVILQFRNGTKMEFYSAERPEGMLGAGVDFAVLDEAATMPSRIWNQIVSPTLMDREGGALMISTPRGKNWFYQVWRKGQDGRDPLWKSWTFPTDSNPTLPPGEADRMADDMPMMEADQEIYAKFVAAGSSVFHWPEKANQDARILDNGLIEGCPPEGHCVLGIDLAQTNDYTVLYGGRMLDRKNVFFERFNQISWSEQKRRIRRAVRTLRKEGATGVTLVIDDGNAGTVVIEDLEEAGYDVVGINFTTNKANMVKLLAKDLEVGHAHLLPNYIEEFENYMMGVTPGGRYTYSAPEGQHDDVVSAKMLQHHGLVNEGVPGITILDAAEVPAEAQAVPRSEDSDDGDEWDDLVDDDGFFEADVQPEEIGLRGFRTPSPNELLQQWDHWT
jgi:hypothetical protein